MKGYMIVDLIAYFSQNDDIVVYEEFIDEYEEDPHQQQCATLIKGQQ